MGTVTEVISNIKQPKYGYLPELLFEKTKYPIMTELFENENLHPSLIGLAVDYMTRYLCSENKDEAFSISLKGAFIINDLEYAIKLKNEIKGIDDNSIINACKLVGYDVCYRVGPLHYKEVRTIIPDKEAIFNIREMLKRAISFFDKYGPVKKFDILFNGGYTEKITKGDADFITEDTLWDFKVSKNKITEKHTLQLLIYYILGLHSDAATFNKIKKLGIFNPRKNMVYIIDINIISKDLIKTIEKDVIGYSDNIISKNNEYNRKEEKLFMYDIMKLMNCSRHVVMRYYTTNKLPLEKENNKYYIYKKDFDEWKLEFNNSEYTDIIIDIITILVITIVSIIIIFSILSFLRK